MRAKSRPLLGVRALLRFDRERRPGDVPPDLVIDESDLAAMRADPALTERVIAVAERLGYFRPDEELPGMFLSSLRLGRRARTSGGRRGEDGRPTMTTPNYSVIFRGRNSLTPNVIRYGTVLRPGKSAVYYELAEGQPAPGTALHGVTVRDANGERLDPDPSRAFDSLKDAEDYIASLSTMEAAAPASEREPRKPAPGASGRKLIRFDFPPDATAEEIAEGIRKLHEKHRKKTETTETTRPRGPKRGPPR